MYLKIDGDNVEVIKHMEHNKPKVLCVLDRVKEELEGFLMYRTMSEKDGMSRYSLPSKQEFQHMLMALDDFFTELRPMLTSEEQQELNKFVKSITAM